MGKFLGAKPPSNEGIPVMYLCELYRAHRITQHSVHYLNAMCRSIWAREVRGPARVCEDATLRRLDSETRLGQSVSDDIGRLVSLTLHDVDTDIVVICDHPPLYSSTWPQSWATNSLMNYLKCWVESFVKK